MPPPTSGAFDYDRPKTPASEPSPPARGRGRVLVGGLVVSLALATLLALLFVPVPAGVERSVEIMVGVVAASLFSVVQFYFGSSAGSADKNDLLLELARGRRPDA